MQLRHLITPDLVLIDDISQSKTAVLHRISELFNKINPILNVEDLFEAYWQRENLGSTAIGYGLVIPHIRLAQVDKPQSCFIKLLNPVDFGAQDKQPADLIIGLLVPAAQHEYHLTILATIIEQFNNSDFRNACRKANNKELLYKILTSSQVELYA